MITWLDLLPAEETAITAITAGELRYGVRLVTAREHAGQPISTSDAQIAAICRVLNATLATRNTADFTGIGVNLIDPWKAGGIAPPGGQHPD